MKPCLSLSLMFAILTMLVESRTTHKNFGHVNDIPEDVPEDHHYQPTNNEQELKVLEKRMYGRHYSQSSSSVKSPQTNSFGKHNIENCKEDLTAGSHSTVNCNTYSGCQAECEDGYLFPNEQSMLGFVCSGGRWVAEGTDFQSVPDCVPEEEEEEEEDNLVEPVETVIKAGDDDKANLEEECKLTPPTDNSRQINCDGKFCELRCHKGYTLPENKSHIILICNGGVWMAEDTKDTNIPLCEPEIPPCVEEPSLPSRSSFVCETSTCEARCEKGHKFPSGKSSVELSCNAGVWVVEADEEDKTKGCVREMLRCGGRTLGNLKNATVECNDESCTAACLPGHKFPSGYPTLTAKCIDDEWQVPDTTLKSIPDCVLELRSHTKCNGSDYLVFPNVGIYKLNTTHVSWPEAQKTCIHEGAHLAVIDSKEELELMKEMIAPHHPRNGWTYAHIGFSDLAKRKVFVTVLGKTLDMHWVKWANRNPSKLNERCGAIDHTGHLHDIFCTSQQIFICEKI